MFYALSVSVRCFYSRIACTIRSFMIGYIPLPTAPFIFKRPFLGGRLV
ncbi:hypothetical protein [Helicobacter pylori]